MQKYIKIHPADKVAVALCPLPAGTVVSTDQRETTLTEDIPQGHKFALCDLAQGEPVIKYGYPIGLTKEPVKTGAWVHVHNMKTALGDLLEYTYEKQDTSLVPTQERFFNGYKRPDGKNGVRNEIWIIPTVGCVNNVAAAIEKQAQSLIKGSIEAIAAFPHPYGCSQMGDDQENTRRILADLITHPNAGGVLVLDLAVKTVISMY